MGTKLDSNKWQLLITRVDNGYVVEGNSDDFERTEVIEADEDDGLKEHEDLLLYVMEYFSFYGGRYDKERLTVIREPGNKYEGTE